MVACSAYWVVTCISASSASESWTREGCPYLQASRELRLQITSSWRHRWPWWCRSELQIWGGGDGGHPGDIQETQQASSIWVFSSWAFSSTCSWKTCSWGQGGLHKGSQEGPEEGPGYLERYTGRKEGACLWSHTRRHSFRSAEGTVVNCAASVLRAQDPFDAIWRPTPGTPGGLVTSVEKYWLQGPCIISTKKVVVKRGDIGVGNVRKGTPPSRLLWHILRPNMALHQLWNSWPARRVPRFLS